MFGIGPPEAFTLAFQSIFIVNKLLSHDNQLGREGYPQSKLDKFSQPRLFCIIV